ncbi:MAG TPA: GntR family transcriptional regulator [Geothrix sp.]|nr:GntR family transcriptional regulator [Geothrix sp.]
MPTKRLPPAAPRPAAETPLLQTRSLREQVYEFLRTEMNTGGLRPGSFLDLNALAERLGVSRTPLRDALLQLEVGGLVEILPRRGFRVKALTMDEIRNIYQIVGALESAAVATTGPKLGKQDLAKMKTANKAMLQAIKAEDYELYYSCNTAFHQVFIDGCANPQMVSLLQSLKHRLYDWPMRKVFLKAWEERSVKEHTHLVSLLEAGQFEEAAAYHRDVHWSFEAQESFIRVYYLSDRPE